jgi:hypothetical protein
LILKKLKVEQEKILVIVWYSGYDLKGYKRKGLYIKGMNWSEKKNIKYWMEIK